MISVEKILNRIEQLKLELVSAENELQSTLDNLFKIYTQDTYHQRIQHNTNNRFPATWVRTVRSLKSEENIYVDVCSGHYEYAYIYCDNLIDAIKYCAKYGCIIFCIGEFDNHINPNSLSSFIRRNENKIKAHSNAMQIQQILYTCNETNLELVKQLLKNV